MAGRAHSDGTPLVDVQMFVEDKKKKKMNVSSFVLLAVEVNNRELSIEG